MQHARQLSAILGAALVLGLLTACPRRVYQESFEVGGDLPISQKIDRAKQVVTEERLAKLRQEVKQRVPTATDDLLSGLSLSWRKIDRSDSTGASRSYVLIYVILERHGGADPAPVIKAAKAILEGEINA